MALVFFIYFSTYSNSYSSSIFFLIFPPFFCLQFSMVAQYRQVFNWSLNCLFFLLRNFKFRRTSKCPTNFLSFNRDVRELKEDLLKI